MANTLNLGNGDWATKENSLLGYNSESGNYKPLPFDFTRASNGTFVNKSGLIETVGSGEPRIDFLGNTSGALLLEPQRTNLLTYSEDFSNASWLKINAGTASLPIVTQNYDISPDGTNNATRVQFNLNGGTTITDRSLLRTSIGSTIDATQSVWLKSTDGTEQKLLWHVGGDIAQFTIDGEWRRYSYFENTIYSGLAIRGSVSTVDSADVLIWGFQAEEGSHPTSYIPTQGSAVTRVADVCNNGGNDQVINSTEGVLYAEIAALADDISITGSEISISDGTSNNLVRVLYSPATSLNSIFVRVDVGGVRVATFNYTSITITDFNKVAVKWKENDFALWINGIEVLTDLSGATFSSSTLSTINFSKAVGGDNFYGNTKDLRVYNTALTDAELIALTS